MARRATTALSATAFALALTAAPRTVAPRTEGTVSRHAPTARLPVRFEANEGQFASDIRYVGRARGTFVALTRDGATLGFEASARQVALRVVGARRTEPEPSSLLVTRSNYFVGKDPALWRTHVANFGRVTLREVLPGVDEVFHGEDGALEYDFVVAPGVRTESIDLTFDGADALTLSATGALEVHLGDLVVPQAPPRVYQRQDGVELAVAGRYRLTGPTTFTFDVGAYDESQPLIIDPVLAYSTFLGGGGDDYGYGVAVDAAGAMYVAGFTTSTNFPTRNALQGTLDGTRDAFVAKVDPQGAGLVYATYLGGTGSTSAYGIGVDATGAVSITGTTDASDFPTQRAAATTNHGGLDAFVTKLAVDGASIVYSTYLGGSLADSAYGLALDHDGAAYVVGTTLSADFPVEHAAQPAFGGTDDAFVAKIGPNGGPVAYATYVGGSGDDEGRALAVDGSGAAYVTGSTTSIDFPLAAGSTPFQPLNGGDENAFVVKVAPNGKTLAYASYLGGSESDEGLGIAVDGAGAAIVTGTATSANFPTASAFQTSPGSHQGNATGFVTKVDPTAHALVYSTFLGGSGNDVPLGLAVDGSGSATLVGYTTSTDFPLQAAVQSANGAGGSAGGSNAFITTLAASGQSLVFSTYLGGTTGDAAQAVATGTGSVYVTGYTISKDFPTVGALQPSLASVEGDNAFLAVYGATRLVGDADAGERDAGGAAEDAGDDAEAVAANDAGGSPDASMGPPTFTASGDGCTCRTSPSADETVEGSTCAVVSLGAVLLARRKRRAFAFPSRLP